MRPSVLFALVGGTTLTGVSASALLLLRAMIAERPLLASWEDLVLVPFMALGAWLTILAMYGAEMNGRVNDANRRTDAMRAAIKRAFESAKADDPDLPDLTDEALDRCAVVIDLDLARQDARADAELGGLKPPSDEAPR